MVICEGYSKLPYATTVYSPSFGLNSMKVCAFSS